MDKVRKTYKSLILRNPDDHDWLTYVRQVSGPELRDAVTKEYAMFIGRGYPAEDAAIWALDAYGCLELQ